MTKTADGYFTASVPGASPGELYSFYVDGQGPFPDPASRYQPQGVHGPSQIVDPAAYLWHDASWPGIALKDAVFYELHVGAFTPEGTFRSAARKLGYLQELGVTAIELMPLADFAGDRNWGYDGVAPFAPARCYGTPDDLRHFVDSAHQAGLAVFIDAVYNHFGPDGAYQGAFSKHYFTKRHRTPWGDAINFDDSLNAAVREYVIESALRWIDEYHCDGLRLDATHAIKDDSARHILAELAAAVADYAAQAGRQVHIIAEDARNLPSLVQPESAGGLGLAAVWADDFHHQMRRTLAGDSDGYFASFDGSIESLAKILRRGWIRGADPSGLAYPQFVYCLQNHDQIGNRALGDRLPQSVDLATYRAASALLLLLPQTPLLFMGQEWAAATPFLYFTDHNPQLGAEVTEGRRREFAGFSAFSHASIPDPQAFETFAASRLRWNELQAEPHASVLRLYRSLLELRRSLPSEFEVAPLDEDTLLLRRGPTLAIVRLRGAGSIDVPAQTFSTPPVWNSEDPRFAPDPRPIAVEPRLGRLTFARPGAIVFRV